MGRSNAECCNTFLLFLLTFLLSIETLICNCQDVINTTTTFRDGDKLISSGGAFEFGFFSGNSGHRYLGIWFGKIRDCTVVWVANRDNPISNTSSTVLKVVYPGVLVLLNATNSILWSSNTNLTSRVAQLPVAQLLDNGNFVVKEANDDNPENYLWESFNNPTDTILAGMKFGHLPTGHENYLSSWKSIDDPGTGEFALHLDPTGYPQAVTTKGSQQVFRTGPWNGYSFGGYFSLRNNNYYSFELVMTGNVAYYYYKPLEKSTVTRFVLNYDGIGERMTWDESQGWVLYRKIPVDNCDTYNQCHGYGNCDLMSAPMCTCLRKFVPKNRKAWAAGNWRDGCVRQTPLAQDCKMDGFVKYSDVKPPDARKSWYNRNMTLSECKEVCLRNCSCMAYTSLDIRNGGSGCLLWLEELLDIRQMYMGAGQNIFVRVASSEVDSKKKGRKVLTASLASTGGLMILILGGSVICCICKRNKFYQKRTKIVRSWNMKESEELELPSIDMYKISKATNDFSPTNKLGEGGFGPVYKGTLEDGQEIAVKRLSETSFQGVDEFKNELKCIARHQHRNLVKLLGYCIQGLENMLIYEYMPNKSLDLILFDDEKSRLLDWPKRFHIITGIARGLMYLHQDSRLRIVHRDLKVSNILLDDDMNPKISDFGLARSFEGNATEAKTNRIVGTYGYMSPEYASKGHFSMKSDVFSFGVIVLEILSGKRNRGFSHKGHHHNLLGHAWRLHKDGMSIELVQDAIMEKCSMSEVLRSIHVGLLCVQAHPDDRPIMSLVVNMLENDVVLPQARRPGFFIEDTGFINDNDNSVSIKASSKNEMTITMFNPR